MREGVLRGGRIQRHQSKVESAVGEGQGRVER